MELVSILIPCFNDGAYLDDALTSVEAQTWPAVEVIVVDDGSTDPDTVATLDRLAGEKRCTLYRQANKGQSAARNLAAQKASGAYYFFLDADNMLLPTYIEKALEQFRRNPKLGVCYARAELFGDVSGLWELPEFSVQQMLIDNVVDMCALVSREAFEAVGGFDESIRHGMQDYDIFLSMIEKGYAFYRIPEVLFHYRIRPTSMTAALVKNPDVVQQLYQQIYRKHKGLYLEHLDEVYPALRKAMGDTKTLQALLDQERKNLAAVQAEQQKAIEGWSQTAEKYRTIVQQLQEEQKRAEENRAQLTALLAQHDKAIDGWNKTAAEYMQATKELAQERKRLEELQAEHDRMSAACAQALKELAQERRRLEELQAEHDRMSAAYAQTLKELAQERKRLEELQAEHDRMNAACAQALEKEKERTAAALRDRDRIMADDRAAEEKLQSAREACAALEEAHNQTQRELQQARHEVALMANSISWKMTKPLRYGKGLVRKGAARVRLLGIRAGRMVRRVVR